MQRDPADPLLIFVFVAKLKTTKLSGVEFAASLKNTKCYFSRMTAFCYTTTTGHAIISAFVLFLIISSGQPTWRSGGS